MMKCCCEKIYIHSTVMYAEYNGLTLSDNMNFLTFKGPGQCFYGEHKSVLTFLKPMRGPLLDLLLCTNK